MFIVDLLHKFELGVWKAVFAHLLWLLYAQGGSGIQKKGMENQYSLIKTNDAYVTTNPGIEIFQHSAEIQSGNLSKMFLGCPSSLLVILRIYFR